MRLGPAQQLHEARVEEPGLGRLRIIRNLKRAGDECANGQRHGERDERHDERVARVVVIRELVAHVVLQAVWEIGRQRRGGKCCRQLAAGGRDAAAGAHRLTAQQRLHLGAAIDRLGIIPAARATARQLCERVNAGLPPLPLAAERTSRC